MKKTLIIILFILTYIPTFAVNIIPVKGFVKSEGKGIEGVLITDGRSFAKTDTKGMYTLNADRSQKYIYYTLPSGYETPIENGIPIFFKELINSQHEYNFELKKSKLSQTKHAFVVWADPQVIDPEEFPLLDKVVADLNKTVAQYIIPVHAISCGDMVFDRLNLFDNYKKVIAKTNLPFYQTIGNHDMDYSNKTHESSTVSYENNFGPAYYSFNKGNIHYIMLNDVFYYGYAYHYMGYLDQKQLDWLAEDLSHVQKGSTVVVSLHIPTMYTDANTHPGMEKRQKNSLINNKAFYEKLEGYDVHILAGHSHTQWNTLISDSILEHTHAAASAAWWQGEIGLDGTPKGYTVYEVDGDKLSWYFKGVGLSEKNQMRTYPVGSDIDNPEAFVVNVFNYDSQWKVKWLEDGKLMGEMEQYWGVDPQARKEYQPGTNKKYSWLGYDTTNHLFKAVPKNGNAQITIEVTDRFGNKYSQIIKNE